MSNVTYGATNWSGKSNNEHGEFGKGTEFLRLATGSNLIRIVTQPYQIWKHNVETEGGKSWGFAQTCPKKEPKDHCPLCEMGNKAKKKFLVGVIDKKIGQYRILEITPGVYDQIVNLTNDNDWGPPTDGSTIFPYDMDLVKNPNPKSPAQTYSLVPKPPKALTAAEIAQAEGADLAELERRSTPPALEKVQERLKDLESQGIIVKTVSGDMFSNTTLDSKNEDGDSYFKNHDAKVS